MLRITRTNNDEKVLLKLEGKLLAAWVEEVLEQIPTPAGIPLQLQLDLSQVSFIDSAGQALLRGLISRGATVSACSSYVSELLHVEKQ